MLTAVKDPHKHPAMNLQYKELLENMQDLSSALHSAGVAQGDKVSLIAENSSRWIVADQAIMWNGAVDAVRGCNAPLEELRYVMQHSESCGAVLEDAATLTKVMSELEKPSFSHFKFVLLLWGPVPEDLKARLPFPVWSYEEALAAGRQATAQRGQPFRPAPVKGSDPATLVYTSGTSGHPKGVVLTHSNLAYQILNLTVDVKPGDKVLSLLPPWHIYERTCTYYVFNKGGQVVYSNIRKFRDDLTAYPPDHFVCVPLVLATLYDKVMVKFKAESALRRSIITALLAASVAYVRARRTVQGMDLRWATTPRPPHVLALALAVAAALAPLHALATKLVHSKIRAALGIKTTVVSGGGSLAPHLDDFYEAIGMEVLNGWGLTETSPVLACRRSEQNVYGSVGVPVAGTQLRVVDPETLRDLPPGRQGLLLARGPGVMRGYHKDESATARVFRAGDGWFDTGDLGWIAPSVPHSRMCGVVVLTGRAKDTIVLCSGKNVEPQPIEDALCSSPLVKNVVLLGQDKRELGALLFPDHEAIEAMQKETGRVLSASELESQLMSAVTQINSARPDYHPEEHIAHVAITNKPLSVDEGTLTRTMKPRRAQIMKVYGEQVKALLGQLRG